MPVTINDYFDAVDQQKAAAHELVYAAALRLAGGKKLMARRFAAVAIDNPTVIMDLSKCEAVGALYTYKGTHLVAVSRPIVSDDLETIRYVAWQLY